jgi:hypothetical protein
MTSPLYQPYYQIEHVVDYDGAEVLDAQWEPVSSTNPEGGTFDYTIDNLGSGSYRFSFVPDLPGTWTIIARVPMLPEDLYYEVETVAGGLVYMNAQSGITLGELRPMVARQLNDYRRVTATGGSETTITDPFGLVENTDYLRGAEILCISGHEENEGLVRKVVSSSFESYTATFIPALPQPVQAGDVFEFYGFARANNYRIDDYNQAINDAIRQGHPQNREKVYMDIESAISETTAGIPIPEPFTHIYGIQWKGTDWYTVPPSRFMGEAGWYVDKARRQIVFGPAYHQEVRNKAVRIYGYTRSPQLLVDSDRTSTDVEWIIDSAVSQLISRNMDQATFAIGQSRANRADQLRGKMMKPAEPNTVSLL